MVKYSLTNKKAQAWSMDAIVALTIFFSGVSVLFLYAINVNEDVNTSLEELLVQGNIASELILSDGSQGIFTDNKINQTKLDLLASSNYDSKRSNLGVIDQFYFTLDNLEYGNSSQPFVGNRNSSEVNNIIRIERIAVYKNKLSKFDMFIWRIN